MSTGNAPIAGRERRLMDPRNAILFEPVTIGPKTLPNRFYQVPHASGFGSIKPRTQAAFRAIKAEGGWGGVCVEYAPVSRDADEVPAVAANMWDEADARGLALTAEAVHARGALAGLELYHGGASSLNGESRAVRIAPSQLASEAPFASLAKEMTRADIPRGQPAAVVAPGRRGHREADRRRRPLLEPGPDGRGRPVGCGRPDRRRAAGDRRPVPAPQDRRGPARRDPRVHRLQHLHPARGGVQPPRLRAERHRGRGVPPRLAPRGVLPRGEPGPGRARGRGR